MGMPTFPHFQISAILIFIFLVPSYASGVVGRHSNRYMSAMEFKMNGDLSMAIVDCNFSAKRKCRADEA